MSANSFNSIPRYFRKIIMTKLHNYFANEWKPDYNKFIYSGWKLLEKIKDNETILDVGCGYNLFKPHLGDRLYGIDPANDNADEVVDIENFKSNKNPPDAPRPGGFFIAYVASAYASVVSSM